MPVDAILKQSGDNQFELIIMGIHGHSSAERLWMGSVTERVLRNSTIPVLAVRKDPPEIPVQQILCPMSPSETGKQALEYAAQISKDMNARLIVLHVVEQGEEPLTCPLVDEQIQKTCRVEEIKFHGNAARTIAEASNDLKPDLIVMGAERRNPSWEKCSAAQPRGSCKLQSGRCWSCPEVCNRNRREYDTRKMDSNDCRDFHPDQSWLAHWVNPNWLWFTAFVGQTCFNPH